MPKSFIKFKPVKPSSEAHNLRRVKLDYVVMGKTKNLSIIPKKISEVREEIKEKYYRTTKQKMQKKATPIREAVVLLPDDNNAINREILINLTKELRKRYGIKAFQLHIHNDEGSLQEGKIKYNYHAHIVFDWTDDKGKSIKLNKQDMSDIQTLTADMLSMERGIKGSKSLSLNHHEYRGYCEIKDKLKEELKQEITADIDKKIREEIIKKRHDNKGKTIGERGIGF